MTIKEIAALAGVSISTVSKIVNNKDQNINPETRDRVLRVVKEYHYSPYATVKNLTGTKSFLLGVLLRSFSQNGLMVNGIVQAAQEKGYQVILLDSDHSSETELKHITSLCKNNVDGVLWEPVNKDSCAHEQYFTQQNIQMCYINAPDLSPCFHMDYFGMGYEMAKKLIQYKHKKIGCLLKENSTRSDMVLEGYKKCLFDYQIPFHEKMKLLISDPEYYMKMRALELTGIVSSHFASSLILYEQMNKLHYYIPSDLSLVSLKDDVRDAVSFPHISNIRIPFFEFGRHICHYLIGKCEKKQETETLSPFRTDLALDNEDSLEIPLFYRSKKVVVAGSINTDITFHVDRLPQAGKTTTILNSTTTLGGKGANQSVGVAKLGHQVSLIGEIGNDADSTMIFDILEQEHVTTLGIHRDMNAQTGKAYIYIEKNGESTIAVLSGANGNLFASDIAKRQHLFKNAGVCLISTEIPLDTAIEAACTARQYGALNIVKPATLKTIPTKLLKHIDIFVPNRKEALTLCPEYESVEEQADYFYRQGILTVIITLGHNGCYVKTSSISQYYPASPFIAIDTTGGADAFISALASYLLSGFSLDKSVRIANYAAGLCISRQGVVHSLVDRNTLEIHIKRIEPKLLN